MDVLAAYAAAGGSDADAAARWRPAEHGEAALR
jgi:hypothetical protein